jgi:Fur family iron response transcriptional regulator
MGETSEVVARLLEKGLRPSAQRVAIAAYVLSTDHHPTADEIWQATSATLPVLSRATVYNTLRLFVDHGLLRELVLRHGQRVYDPNLDDHHHFIDDETGRIYDLPLDAIPIAARPEVPGFDVRRMTVTLHGRKTGE